MVRQMPGNAAGKTGTQSDGVADCNGIMTSNIKGTFLMDAQCVARSAP